MKARRIAIITSPTGAAIRISPEEFVELVKQKRGLVRA